MDQKQQPGDTPAQPQTAAAPPQQPGQPVVNDVVSPPSQVSGSPQPATPPPNSAPTTSEVKAAPPEQTDQAAENKSTGATPNGNAHPTTAPALGGTSSQVSVPNPPAGEADASSSQTQESDKPSKKKAKKKAKPTHNKPKSNKPTAFIILAVTAALVLMGLAVLSYMEQADEDVNGSTAAPVSQTQQAAQDDSVLTEQISQLQSEVEALSEDLAEAEQALSALDENIDQITDEPATPDSSEAQELTD